MASYFARTGSRQGLAAFAIALITLVSAESFAQRTWKNPSSSPGGSARFASKTGAKQSRWTLQQWLEQKERNKMMDLWLGMYAPSPYEFILSAAQLDYRASTDIPAANYNQKSFMGSMFFYALVLGIGVEHENNWNEQYTNTQGSINVRIMGNSNESTHLNIFGGLRNRIDATTNLQGQPFAGAELQIYIQSQWGLHGNYRSYFSKEVDATTGNATGSKTEGGIFIEFSPVRIFGNWYQEDYKTATTGGTEQTKTRTGWLYGLRLLF